MVLCRGEHYIGSTWKVREVRERTYGLVGAETATFLTPSEKRMDSIESDTTVV